MSKQRQAEETIQLSIRLVVKDKKGRVLEDTGRKKSHSFVIQFLKFFYAMLSFDVDGATNYSATETSGVAGYLYKGNVWADKNFRVDAGVGDHEWGIVVGTGIAALSNTDIRLATQLTEGVGAGNITHGAMDMGTTGIVGAAVEMDLIRAFTNNTGSPITVNESGLYCRHYTDDDYFCLIRDLTGAITIPHLCSLTVYYTLRTTV